MPAFTAIIHSIYLLLIPVGILIGRNVTDYRNYSLTFIFYLILVPAISGILNKIMFISESFTQIDGNVERMEEILHIPVLPDYRGGVKEQGKDIVFDHVSFSYEAEADVVVKALDNVSFHARQGEVTAIVGPSGGGKSTIANLISRFWDVTEGNIQIGGVDIREIPLAELMKQVGFVFQDTFLFKQSVLDNIRMGNPDATEEQVIEAAKAAQCHEFIEKLPNGYHTVIGSSGIRLSGGERQRIAIARALIAKPDYLILDEAGANLDHDTYMKIYHGIRKKMEGNTIVFIAHDMREIAEADYLVVMHHGRLEACGTPEEVFAVSRTYQEYLQSAEAS